MLWRFGRCCRSKPFVFSLGAAFPRVVRRREVGERQRPQLQGIRSATDVELGQLHPSASLQVCHRLPSLFPGGEPQ